MKLSSITLLLSLTLLGCNEQNVTNNVSNQVVAVQTAYLPADTIYSQPTDIGDTVTDQKLRLQALMVIVKPSQEQRRTIALTQLALFSSDDQQSLEKLVVITMALEALSNNAPVDYELMAAYGSALSYQSIFLQNDLGKMNLTARKGMRIMDRAIKQAPGNLGARFLRGVSYANMPSFLNRAQFAINDLQLLKQHSRAKKQSNFIVLVNYYLALAFSRNDQTPQAKALWTTLAKQSNTTWKALAIIRLKEIN